MQSDRYRIRTKSARLNLRDKHCYWYRPQRASYNGYRAGRGPDGKMVNDRPRGDQLISPSTTRDRPDVVSGPRQNSRAGKATDNHRGNVPTESYMAAYHTTNELDAGRVSLLTPSAGEGNSGSRGVPQHITNTTSSLRGTCSYPFQSASVTHGRR